MLYVCVNHFVFSKMDALNTLIIQNHSPAATKLELIQVTCIVILSKYHMSEKESRKKYMYATGNIYLNSLVIHWDLI